MHERDHDRPGPARGTRPPHAPARSGAVPALALQRAVGNRGTGQVLARKAAPGKNAGTFENSVTIGKLGPIEVTESNIEGWTGKNADANDLIVTTKAGEHSDELKQMAESRTRIDSIQVSAVTGQNSWTIVTFKNAVIRGYEADASGKTEHWKAVRFDHVDIKRTAIGKPRP